MGRKFWDVSYLKEVSSRVKYTQATKLFKSLITVNRTGDPRRGRTSVTTADHRYPLA